MRHAIESGERILHELCIQNTEFVINEVCTLFKVNSLIHTVPAIVN